MLKLWTEQPSSRYFDSLLIALNGDWLKKKKKHFIPPIKKISVKVIFKEFHIIPFFLREKKNERSSRAHVHATAQQWAHDKEILRFLFEILDRLIFEEFFSKVLSILNEKK